MLNNLIVKTKLNNCFLDLQRAATHYYQNPQGKTHLIFLKHAQKILVGLKTRKARQGALKLSQLEKKLASGPKSSQAINRVADSILTLGILLKT